MLYDPIQAKNYLSQFQRYIKATQTFIAATQQDSNGNPVYLFCSHLSPTGYWKVTQGTSGSLFLANPVLTIICPTPFYANDLVGVVTDATDLTWIQQQGRTTSISPASGDGSTNPVINIIGQRQTTDPPILILVEVTDNPSSFDYLLINTTCTDYRLNLSGADYIVADGEPGRSVTTTHFLPGTPNTAFQWVSGSIPVGWDIPLSETAWIVEYVLEQNINGVWTAIATYPPTQQRSFSLAPNTEYRITTVHNVLGLGASINPSSPIFYSLPQSNQSYIFGDDARNGASGVTGIVAATQYPLSGQIYHPQNDTRDGASGVTGIMAVVSYSLSGSIIG
jgi:hypothetical protein